MKMITAAMLSTLSLISYSAFATVTKVTNYKSPYCGCCTEWSTHMQQAGFKVNEQLQEDMTAIKQQLGITPKLASCHTAVIDGYVFEGHIPATDIQAFLANPPKNAKGLAAPGMPIGSPGMESGDKKEAYSIFAFNEQGQVFEFAHHEGN